MRFFIFCLIILIGCEGERPESLGVNDGRFRQCPDKSNSVSSQCENPKHKMNSIDYNIDGNLVVEEIISALSSYENKKLITRNLYYLHYEFSTSVGWVDDVEFFIDTLNHRVDYMSASRIGYSDFGTNRERMEELFEKITKRLSINNSESLSYALNFKTFGNIGLGKQLFAFSDTTILKTNSLKDFFPKNLSSMNSANMLEMYNMPVVKNSDNYPMPILEPDSTINHK